MKTRYFYLPGGGIQLLDTEQSNRHLSNAVNEVLESLTIFFLLANLSSLQVSENSETNVSKLFLPSSSSALTDIWHIFL